MFLTEKTERGCRMLMLFLTQIGMLPTTMKMIPYVFTHLGVTVFMSLLLRYL